MGFGLLHLELHLHREGLLRVGLSTGCLRGLRDRLPGGLVGANPLPRWRQHLPPA